jgi:hypothetical protein
MSNNMLVENNTTGSTCRSGRLLSCKLLVVLFSSSRQIAELSHTGHDCAFLTLRKELSLKITAKVNLYYIKTFSSYRAVNTLRLSYKNQSINAV